MARHKDANWKLDDPCTTWEEVAIAVLMDIRDEAKETNRLLRDLSQKAGCYRIPRALDALHSMGVAARRRKKKRTK